MHAFLRSILAAAGLALAGHAAAQATFYEHEGFTGRSLSANTQLRAFERRDFAEQASSVVINGERWEVCPQPRFEGRCVVLRPGRYPSLAALGLDDRIASARVLRRDDNVDDARYAPLPIAPQITFYQREGFEGRSFSTAERVGNLRRAGFDDDASSAVVLGDRFEACEERRFGGRCVVLRPGRYASLAEMGLNDRVSSVRPLGHEQRVADDRYAPAPVPVYDSRRRGGERLFEVDVASARAVLATSGQRCWVEREQVAAERSGANVGGAIAGALLGGILGHQVGGGSGKDIATVGGVLAGAAIGANVGRDGQPAAQDVQRCENVPGGAKPAYWDVSYNFRGQDHRIQMAVAPGRTITVNAQGEPRQ